MATDVLPKFQAFLRAKKIVPDKQIQFYALWASKFLAFQNRNSFTKVDIARDQFLAWLRYSQHVQDFAIWQKVATLTQNQAFDVMLNRKTVSRAEARRAKVDGLFGFPCVPASLREIHQV